MNLKHEKLVLLFLLFVVFLRATNSNAEEQAEKNSTFHAGGGEWIVQDNHWAEYNGFWRVNSVATLVRQPKGQLLFADVIGPICDRILDTLPNAPKGVDQNNIYRVELNSRSFVSGVYGNLLFPHHIPIQVRQGKCQLRIDGVYTYTYPGGLEGWEQTKVLFDENSTDVRAVALHFRKIDPEQDGKLPFNDACNAFFSDPPPALEMLREHLGLPEDLDEQPIRVVEFNDYTYDVSNSTPDYATYTFHQDQFQLFKISNGQCTPLPESVSK